MSTIRSQGPLRLLLWPVYAPSFGYATGVSALLPAQVLLALKLGFTPAQVALLATAVGGFGVLASVVAGSIVQRVGEQRALWWGTTPGVVLALVTWPIVGSDPATARVLLVVTLLALDLADAVWSIARQGLIADLAPLTHRGRAMNVYGASQRLGRVVGPFIAAVVLTRLGPEFVLPVTAAIVTTACVAMSHHLRRDTAAEGGRAPHPAVPTARRPVRGIVILGLGVLTLAAVRSAKETLVPLRGADGLGLPPATVALVVGVTSLAELILFWPAGIALDRLGRGPVAASCLALMGSGLILMTFSTDPAWFVGAAALIGLGDGVGAGIVKTLGIDLAPGEGRGRFLGRWEAIASAGSFAAPALARAVIQHVSLAAALPAVGVLGVAGAMWMAWWTPRILGSPRHTTGAAGGHEPT